MTVDPEMMDPQLRRRGVWARRLFSARSEATLRRAHRLTVAARPAAVAWRPGGLHTRQEWIGRGDGTRLRLLVCGPPQRRAQSVGLIWMHGGGHVLGCPEQDVPIYRRLTARGAVIVAPDYRLAPERPYPAALDDCYAALMWLRDNAERLGVRPDAIAVGGESAGGGLAAGLTLAARDRGDVSVAFQMPIYPMIDDRLATASARDNDAPVWDSVTNAAAWRLYLGDRAGTDRVPAYAAPARATEFGGLPPTFTYVGDLEPFRDETIAYVDNLRSAGVPVEFETYPGCWHGFDRIAPKAEVSVRARRARDGWFERMARQYCDD